MEPCYRDHGYRDEIGWTRIDGVVSSERAGSIIERCEQLLAAVGSDIRAGDKPAAGTRRLVDVVARVPEAASVVPQLEPVVAEIIGGPFALSGAVYRCPDPGFGQQALHADDLPRVAIGPNLCATAIVALVPFTTGNGATRVVPGSHRRPDLQRRSDRPDHEPGEVQLGCPLGGALVFSGHLLHSGMRNNSRRPRPALQFTFRAAGP